MEVGGATPFMPMGWSVPCTQRWVALLTDLLPLGSTWIFCDDVPNPPFPISTAHGARSFTYYVELFSAAPSGSPLAQPRMHAC